MVRRILLLALGMVASAACEKVLDIQDAQLDPTFGAPVEPPDETPAPDAGKPPPSPECERYCSTVMANCADASAVYTTLESCHAVCAVLPMGQEGDEIGNTVSCRTRSAEAATSEPDFYCPAAGPGGNGICGDNCEALCTITNGVCSGPDQQWDSVLSCKSNCDSLPDLQTYTTASDSGMAKGDHVQCRLFHVSAAAVYDPALHCKHAAGASPCAPPKPMNDP